MKNIKKLVRDAVIAKNLNKCINSKSLGCFAIAGVLGFTTLVPAQVATAQTNYTEKVVYDITSSAPKFSSLADMKSKSIKITPEGNPDYFLVSPYTGKYIVKVESLPMDGKVRYYESKNPDKDAFNVKGYVITKVKEVTSGGIPGYKVIIGITGDDIFDGLYLDSGKTTEPHEFYKGVSDEAIASIKANLAKVNPPSAPKTEEPKVEEPKQEEPTIPTESGDPTSFRLGGSDRYETAIEIAKEALNGGKMKSVILASGLDFPDSLSASGLSAKYDAPILLVNKNAANSRETLNYIKNNMNKDGTIYILGGTTAVSDDIIDNLKNNGFTNFNRLGGSDRYETNRIINKNVGIEKGTPVVIANGLDFADALSISSISGIKGMPIYITKKDAIDNKTLSEIQNIAPSKIYIVGGNSAISSDVENTLKGITSDITRLGGADRYETSIAIAKHFDLDTDTVAIANGLAFPDALSGSVLASKHNAPILLVKNDVSKQKAYLDTTNINRVYVLGGTTVINDSLVQELKK